MAELEAAVTTGTPEKRVETQRRITSLFLDQADHLSATLTAIGASFL